MAVTPDTEDQVSKKTGQSRRKLIKYLSLAAAAGYVAPKAVLISDAWACHGPNVVPDMPNDTSVCL